MFHKTKTDDAPERIPPIPEDLEQLSSAGHGRIKEVVNDIVVYEAWYRDWQLHGEHGAAFVKRDENTGVATIEVWIKKGIMHRENAPAKIERDPQTGVVTRELWIVDGKMHRIGAPAWIERDPQTGAVALEFLA